MKTRDDTFAAVPAHVHPFRDHGRWLAETHVIRTTGGSDSILPRLAQNEQILLHSFHIIESAVKAGQRIVPAATWLLDNFYILEEQIWLARRHFPKSYSKELPRLETGELTGRPRIYALVLDLIQHSDGLLDEIAIREFVGGYQEREHLSVGELWAVPIMLRFALIENARHTAAKIATGAIDRRTANHWADLIARVSADDTDAMLQVIAELSASRPRTSTVFITELARRLLAYYPAPTIAMGWIEQHLPHSDSSLDHLFLAESKSEASDQVSMSHTVTSLRAIQAIDWRQFVEDTNAIDPILAEDGAGSYTQMDFATRDRYRHVVEELARRYLLSEEAVAKAAVELSQMAAKPHNSQGHSAHVGYYLIDRGRFDLELSLLSASKFGIKLRRFLTQHRIAFYIGSLTLVTVLIVAGMVLGLPRPKASPWVVAASYLSCTIVASQAALLLVNWTTTIMVRPKRLPRMDFSSGLPDNAGTIVAVPTMLSSAKTIERLLHGLEVSYLGNVDPKLHFALLTDYLDASQEVMAHDDALLQQVTGGIDQLNAKYGKSGHRPFHLCHRPRSWNAVERRWMGYERKRGKLLAFAALLRGGGKNEFSHLVGDASVFSRIRYVISLDTDTSLPHGAARQLISTMAHPLNRPVLDRNQGRVVDGYSILQPRVAIHLSSINKSWFSRLFASDPGIDPYTREISDVYQDLFGEGSFVGKGIFEIDTFLATLERRFPENWILSHDLIEGCFARSGLISDVILYEDFPARYQADLNRRHRWIRGDWQIAPWLLPWAPGPDGCFEANSLSMLSRWKIADNLRRSLVPLAMIVTLFLGWTITQSPILWTMFVVSVVVLPSLTQLLHKIVFKSRDSDWLRHLAYSGRDLLKPALQAIFSLFLLPFEAWTSLNAIVLSIFRMTIGRRKLLEWNPAHESDRRGDDGLRYHLKTMGPPAVFSLGTLVLLAQNGLNSLPASLLLSLWTFTPLFSWWMSLPHDVKATKITATERDFLLSLAQDTWKFFDHYITAEDHWLPPDNVQYHPGEEIAHRTSPTNIGLVLLANLAAFDFKFIAEEEFFRRTALTLETMERLERYRGHFFNWYDTRTLEVMRPRYISTVDSGNLVACLLTLGIALDQIVDDGLLTNQEFDAAFVRDMARRLRDLAACDFSFLYDKARRLLAIGYDVHDHRLDSAYYDLLASEARLASFFAIATGQLPVEHWYSLGRLMNHVSGQRVLLSWSGSMFEYLMPNLILPDFDHTLLSESHRAAVRCQRVYGKLRNVPWGISESGYFATDLENNFQYRAFGVPGLGFKRGLGNDLVVAPYATCLALIIDPKAACANLQVLKNAGFVGEFGFYEAIDYTPERLPANKSFAVVRSHMAHHQSMSFLAFAHCLLDQPLQRRLARSPLFQSAAQLLEEGRPRATPFPFYGTETPAIQPVKGELEPAVRMYRTPSPDMPAVHLLSNGNYHVMITAAGDGYSSCNRLFLTRYRPDPLLRSHGVFCYLKDNSSGLVWSTGYAPTGRNSRAYEAIFTEGKAEFKRRDGNIETHTEISVSPEYDAEVRRIRLTNRGRSPSIVELTSFAEVDLAPAGAYEAHPAFSGLFIETETIQSLDSIVCHRRSRSEHELNPWLYVSFVVHGETNQPVSFETDRHAFIGRGKDVGDPAAIRRPLTGTGTAALDPILGIRQTVTLRPFETIIVDFILGVAPNRDHCLEHVKSFRERARVDRVFELSWAHSQTVFQQLNITAQTAQIFNRVAGLLLYPQASVRAAAKVLMQPHRRGQSGLWGYGISGDLPIILVRLSRVAQLPLFREVLTAQAYWRRKGLEIDLVVWNDDDSSYRQQLQDAIGAEVSAMGSSRFAEGHGGVFPIRQSQISEEDRRLIQSAAHIIFDGQIGSSLAQHLGRPPAKAVLKTDKQALPICRLEDLAEKVPSSSEPHLSEDGREYVMSICHTSPTPLPWVNVISNPEFGTVVSERGSSYTWFENAHEFRLSPWFNDPVTDPSGESYYIQDLDTKRFWSPMPWPTEGEGDYVVRHGFGYSVFDHCSSDIVSETWVFVDAEEPVKYVLIRLHNKGSKARRLAVMGMCEWVLGSTRSKTAMHIVTSVDEGIIFARNPYLIDGSERTAFFSARGSTSLSGDRREILGDLGNRRTPAAMQSASLSGRTGPALDPCAALRVPIELLANGSHEVVFMLGAGHNHQHAVDLAKTVTHKRPPAKALRTVRQVWQQRLSGIAIETPDRSINALANGWLLYQTISSRLWGRSGFYQSGGAYGFRDQLQDVVSLLHAEPALARAHLLRAAAHQFPEGDVQHWWHPPSGRGVRTGFSDDYLWLPWAVAHYVSATGDYSVLDEQVPFVEGRPLKAGEESYYDVPSITEGRAPLYQHCALSINRASRRLGVHGLPLMGTGDWNDGMNLVGAQGKGESVWLAFFLCDILERFGRVAGERHDETTMQLCTSLKVQLSEDIDLHAWDGKWYLRAFFDSGDPLGSEQNSECQIDLLPQAWAVLSGAAKAARASQAMESVNERLVRRADRLIQLFDPPFSRAPLNPGYIKGYPAGVRENGGQYTHAAVWAIWAFAELGQNQTAWELLDLINPMGRGSRKKDMCRYMVEPYVVAADVYSKPPHTGRGGWTWYTGSAAWMYRLIVERLLGLRREGDRLRFDPRLNPQWDDCKVRYRFKSTSYHVTIKRGPIGTGCAQIQLDGALVVGDGIKLVDDRLAHQIVIHTN